MPDYHDVCRLDDLRSGQGKTVALGSRLIALFLIDGRVCAIDDVCPHMGASLAAGELDGPVVTCPWHGWRFRVTDGTWADNPRIKIPCYAVRVVDGIVQVQPPEPRPASPGAAP